MFLNYYFLTLPTKLNVSKYVYEYLFMFIFILLIKIKTSINMFLNEV